MAIIAPYSKHKKGNLRIFVIVLIVLTLWFAYDGYFNKGFIEKNSDENGNPNSTLAFNQKSPPFLIAGAVVLGVLFFVIKGKKITADENGISDGKRTVPYDNIEKVDKTDFKNKGCFTITYKSANASEQSWKISDKNYDNLSPILDEIVAKIS